MIREKKRPKGIPRSPERSESSESEGKRKKEQVSILALAAYSKGIEKVGRFGSGV